MIIQLYFCVTFCSIIHKKYRNAFFSHHKIKNQTEKKSLVEEERKSFFFVVCSFFISAQCFSIKIHDFLLYFP